MPSFGIDYSTTGMLVDLTGDGRPDAVRWDADRGLVVFPNTSGARGLSLGDEQPLGDGVLSSRPPEARTLGETRYTSSVAIRNDQQWRQMIDVNGDGRLDIVDATAQAGHWVFFLNTPDPTVGSGIRWQRRSFSIGALAQQLRDRGHSISAEYLPLSRRATRAETVSLSCWLFNGFEWSEDPDGFNHGGCHGYTGSLPETTITEWEFKDINGDGYPDVVFNSSRVIPTQRIIDERTDDPGDQVWATRMVFNTEVLQARDGNRIDAVLNVLGARLTNASDQLFSLPVTLRASEGCGVARWITDGTDSRVTCSMIDVNGDGIIDRVDGNNTFLGTGNLGTAGFFSATIITLPGPPSVQRSNRLAICRPPATGAFPFTSSQIAGLRDITGDGLPDYVAMNGSGWEVFIGTGTGFTSSSRISGRFALSTETEYCGGQRSVTDAGLFDITGDGMADVVMNDAVHTLVPPAGTPSTASAGRLIQISNGFGAHASIRYRSIKQDGTLHQVPFPEIVIESVEVTGARSLGGDLAITRYAYGDAGLVFDPVRDAFAFPGYRRHVTLPARVGQSEDLTVRLMTFRSSGRLALVCRFPAGQQLRHRPPSHREILGSLRRP